MNTLKSVLPSFRYKYDLSVVGQRIRLEDLRPLAFVDAKSLILALFLDETFKSLY